MIDVYTNRVPLGLLTDEEKQQIADIPKEELIFASPHTLDVWEAAALGNSPTLIYRRRPKPALIVPKAVWAVLPEGVDWAVINSVWGGVVASDAAPRCSKTMDYWTWPSCYSKVITITHLLGVDGDPSRWRDSLTKRPEGV